jgi:hypothetical protein
MVKNAPIFDGLLLLINISEVKIALFPQSIMLADFLYILVLRLVCLKMFISSQSNLPQLQYCASKLRIFTDFENLSI